MFPFAAVLLSSLCELLLLQPGAAAGASRKHARIATTIFEDGCDEGFDAVREDGCIVKCVNRLDLSEVVEAYIVGFGEDECCKYVVYLNGDCPCKSRKFCRPFCEPQVFVEYGKCVDVDNNRLSDRTAYASRLFRTQETILDDDCAEGYKPVRKGDCITSCESETDPTDVVKALRIASADDDCCRFELYVNGHCPCKVDNMCKEECKGKRFKDFAKCRERFAEAQTEQSN